MDAIAPSSEVIAAMRAIAQADFSYKESKAIGQAAGWTLMDDEPGLGFIAFKVSINAPDEFRRLAVEIQENSDQPEAFLPLFYYEYYESNPDPFDEAFRSLLNQLSGLIGKPSGIGEYGNEHREDWSYMYACWRLDDATLVLVQDEFDIQFGMDITLWAFAPNEPIKFPLHE